MLFFVIFLKSFSSHASQKYHLTETPPTCDYNGTPYFWRKLSIQQSYNDWPTENKEQEKNIFEM